MLRDVQQMSWMSRQLLFFIYQGNAGRSNDAAEWKRCSKGNPVSEEIAHLHSIFEIELLGNS